MHVWLGTLWLKLQSPCQSSSHPVCPHERHQHVCTRQANSTFESKEFSWGCVPHAVVPHTHGNMQWTCFCCCAESQPLTHPPSHPHKQTGNITSTKNDFKCMYVHEYKSRKKPVWALLLGPWSMLLISHCHKSWSIDWPIYLGVHHWHSCQFHRVVHSLYAFVTANYNFRTFWSNKYIKWIEKILAGNIHSNH